jgi:precorrin-2 dehydrogenase / sirohydrochlorin ferrochelatase
VNVFELTVSLDVTGRRCVVVGGGREADLRVDALLHANAEVVVVTPSPSPHLTTLAADGGIELRSRGYAVGDLAGAFLAYVTREDDTPVAAVWRDAEATGVLLSTLDDTARCHFASPAVVRRGDLAITVATAGRAPALAKRLRQQLEADLGDELADLVDLLEEVRSVALPRTVAFDVWSSRWTHALADLEGLRALLRDGDRDAARERVLAVLEGSA